MKENSLYDKKSLKEITGKTADWNEVAKDCVAFSNAQGGIIDYGIEDDADEPDTEQRIPESLVVTLQNKINGKTSNVSAYGEVVTHNNGGQYLRLHIARGNSAASTTSGKFFIRVSDNSVPVYNPQNEAFLHSRTSRAISQNETYRRNTTYPPLKNRPAYAGIHIL